MSSHVPHATESWWYEYKGCRLTLCLDISVWCWLDLAAIHCFYYKLWFRPLYLLFSYLLQVAIMIRASRFGCSFFYVVDASSRHFVGVYLFAFCSSRWGNVVLLAIIPTYVCLVFFCCSIILSRCRGGFSLLQYNTIMYPTNLTALMGNI